MPKFEDLTGKLFGRWRVIQEASPRVQPSGRRQTMWQCLCECGSVKDVAANSLSKGVSRSCGCLNADLASQRVETHGLSKTSEYKTWQNIKSRCYEPKSRGFENYGGRGIEVCDRWLESFENFHEDMGNKPSKGHSIERVDVNGNYCADNCLWIEKGRQSRNQRKKKNNKSSQQRREGVRTVSDVNRCVCRYSYEQENKMS